MCSKQGLYAGKSNKGNSVPQKGRPLTNYEVETGFFDWVGNESSFFFHYIMTCQTYQNFLKDIKILIFKVMVFEKY